MLCKCLWLPSPDRTNQQRTLVPADMTTILIVGDKSTCLERRGTARRLIVSPESCLYYDGRQYWLSAFFTCLGHMAEKSQSISAVFWIPRRQIIQSEPWIANLASSKRSVILLCVCLDSRIGSPIGRLVSQLQIKNVARVVQLLAWSL